MTTPDPYSPERIRDQVTNMLIEFAGPDLALVETYLWSVQWQQPAR